MTERLTLHLRGHVQGVGMRWFVRVRALELGLVGTATNLADGRVEVVAEGERKALEQLTGALAGAPGRIDYVAQRWAPARHDLAGFTER